MPQYGKCPFAVETMWKNSGILVQKNALSSSEYWKMRTESTNGSSYKYNKNKN